MDVDLLRPGNVPISPNTVLWFEFLLNPNLLEEHLNKANPDPVPTDLLMKFLTLSVEPPTEDSFEQTKNFKCSKRHLCMKILSLKIVAFWKWDLETIMSKIPLQLQYVLFRDLLCLTADDPEPNLIDPTLNNNLNFALLRDEQVFAVSIYHRNVESADDIMSCVMDEEGKSELILKKILDLQKGTITIPTFHNILAPTELEDPKQSWENGLVLPARKFYSQICYDLGFYKLYREMTTEAAAYFLKCKNFCSLEENLDTDSVSHEYCKINQTNLTGLCCACGVTKNPQRDLIHQFNSAIRDGYSNILDILQVDNVKREIPLIYRDALELDLASSLANGKITATRDMVFQIQTLNAIRRVFDRVPYPSVMDYVARLKSFHRGIAILTKSLKLVLDKATAVEIQNIRAFLFVLLRNCGQAFVNAVVTDPEIKSLFSDMEIQSVLIYSDTEVEEFPDLTVIQREREERIMKIGNPHLDVCVLERRIINVYDPAQLKDLMQQFSFQSGTRPLLNVFSKWRLPQHEWHLVNSLPNQDLRHYCYVVLAKTKELIKLRNFAAARNLLNFARNEVNRHRFSYLIMWELLYVEMLDLLYYWPASHIDRTQLSGLCEDCLLQSHQACETHILPRFQIRDLCVITLLNIRRDLLNRCFSKRLYLYIKLAHALSSACDNVQQFQGNEKFPKDAWDLILPAFFSGNQQRRPQQMDRDVNKNTLCKFFASLRDPHVIDVALSLLTRVQNVVRDESQLELYYSYTQWWPLTITNSISYNAELVLESIEDVLRTVLRYQPLNKHWLKLLGDVNFVKGHHSSALKNYLEAYISASDYFEELSIAKNVIDDNVHRRMIKCCMSLQCFTQIEVISLLELNSNNMADIKHEASKIRKCKFLRALTRQYVCY